MSDEWLRSEPEVGQVVTVSDTKYQGLAIYEGRKVTCIELGPVPHFRSHNFAFSSIAMPRWQPITTPEERRLRAEVERLREENEKLKRFIQYFKRKRGGDIVLGGGSGLIETEAGGADHE